MKLIDLGWYWFTIVGSCWHIFGSVHANYLYFLGQRLDIESGWLRNTSNFGLAPYAGIGLGFDEDSKIPLYGPGLYGVRFR